MRKDHPAWPRCIECSIGSWRYRRGTTISGSHRAVVVDYNTSSILIVCVFQNVTVSSCFCRLRKSRLGCAFRHALDRLFKMFFFIVIFRFALRGVGSLPWLCDCSRVCFLCDWLNLAVIATRKSSSRTPIYSSVMLWHRINVLPYSMPALGPQLILVSVGPLHKCGLWTTHGGCIVFSNVRLWLILFVCQRDNFWTGRDMTKFLISAPSLGVCYFLSLTVCPSVCLWQTLILVFFCFWMESSQEMAISFPWQKLQNVVLRSLI